MKFDEIHHISLNPLEYDGYENALKSFVLFSTIDDKTIIALSKEHISVSLDYLSKFQCTFYVGVLQIV